MNPPCRFIAGNLVLEYTLSASACARAATAYGATLLDLQPESAIVPLGVIRLDFFAVGLTALLGLLLCLGTKESALFNTGMPSSKGFIDAQQPHNHPPLSFAALSLTCVLCL